MSLTSSQHTQTVDVTQSIQAKVYCVSCQVKARYLLNSLSVFWWKTLLRWNSFSGNSRLCKLDQPTHGEQVDNLEINIIKYKTYKHVNIYDT